MASYHTTSLEFTELLSVTPFFLKNIHRGTPQGYALELTNLKVFRTPQFN